MSKTSRNQKLLLILLSQFNAIPLAVSLAAGTKMEQLGTKNMGAYLRKMAIDGYIIKVDYTEQKKLAAAVSDAAANINHICRRINQTGRFYADDVAELKARQAEIWQLLKQSQRDDIPP